VRRVDVLGQHQHADTRPGVLDGAGGAGPLVGERRRHTDVHDREIGIVRANRRAERLGVADGRDDAVSVVAATVSP
jgi:hypothetical protein